MNKGYSVKKINNDKYDLIGIKLDNGGVCWGWKNKGSANIGTIVIVVNNGNSVVLKDEELCISLEGITNLEEQLKMLGAFVRELVDLKINVRNVSFQFIVNNVSEEMVANEIISKLGIKASVIKTFEEKKEEVVTDKKVEDNVIEINDTKTLEKEEDVIINNSDNNVVVSDKEEVIDKKNDYSYKFEPKNTEVSYDDVEEQKVEEGASYQNNKGKVKTLKPAGGVYYGVRDTYQEVYPNANKKSAAFVSLPVIMFIISLLLLIGSGIILFMMK